MSKATKHHNLWNLCSAKNVSTRNYATECVLLKRCNRPQQKIFRMYYYIWDFLSPAVKNLPATQEIQIWSLVQEDLLEDSMATHSSILAGRIPWTEEPGGLQSSELQSWSQLRWLNTAQHIYLIAHIQLWNIKLSHPVTKLLNYKYFIIISCISFVEIKTIITTYIGIYILKFNVWSQIQVNKCILKLKNIQKFVGIL